MIYTCDICSIPIGSHFKCAVSTIFDSKSGALRLNTRREGPDQNSRAVSMPPTLLGSLHPMCLFERSNGLKHPAGGRALLQILLFLQRKKKKEKEKNPPSSHWKSA